MPPHIPQVLYVEDHPVNSILMSAVFERIPGCRLLLADSGSDALAKARALCPALLLLDFRLPDMTGAELLLRLRRLPGCEFTPAVAVTAEHGLDPVAAGFDELWPKPLDLAHVVERVEVLVALQALPQQPLLRLSTPELLLKYAAGL